MHHYGLRDKPSSKAKSTSYPDRQLLGVNSTDKRFLRDLLLRQLSFS
ncbi:phage virion morphogenesis protein [Candidatus Vondammii sp. HM_W22]